MDRITICDAPPLLSRYGGKRGSIDSGLARKAEQITRYLNDEHAKALGDYLVDPERPRASNNTKEEETP